MKSFIKVANILIAIDDELAYNLVEMVGSADSLTEIAQLVSELSIAKYKEKDLLAWAAFEIKNNLTQL